MKINLDQLKENVRENILIGNLSRFRESESDFNNIDTRNQLNDLTLREWIQYTKSYHNIQSKHQMDSFKAQHPAPFEEEFVYFYARFFSKKGDLIFDPFMGSGTTGIVSNLIGRRCFGIELNPEFIILAKKRFELNGVSDQTTFLMQGDSGQLLNSRAFHNFLLKKFGEIKVTITSPPFFNILKYNSNKKNTPQTQFKNYGDHPDNLENVLTYEDFMQKLTKIFENIYLCTKNSGHLVIDVQNYYRPHTFKNNSTGKIIQFYAWDLAQSIAQTRWIPCGEQVWCFPKKNCFPFGYPYSYQSNIHHNYVLIFLKDTDKK